MNWSFITHPLFTLCAGVYLGLMVNILRDMRTEWNAVVDRIREGLLRRRRDAVSDVDLDLLLALSLRWQRGRLKKAVQRYQDAASQHSGTTWGQPTYSDADKQAFERACKALLEKIRRR